MQRPSYCYLLTRTLSEGGCRYYVGIRTCPVGKTPETDTSYMGGGDAIRPAVKAHPGEFSKTILDVFGTVAEAAAMERALVGLATANSPWSYNLMEGGQGGALKSEATKAKMRASQRRPEVKAKKSAVHRKRFEDPAERERQREASQRMWAEATPDQRESHSKATTEGCERAWSSATPQRRAARVAAAVEGKRRARLRRQVLDSMALAHGLGDVVAERRAREKAEQGRKVVEGMRRPEVRAKSSAGVKSYWARMTPEERSAENKRRAAARRDQRSRDA